MHVPKRFVFSGAALWQACKHIIALCLGLLIYALPSHIPVGLILGFMHKSPNALGSVFWLK